MNERDSYLESPALMVAVPILKAAIYYPSIFG